jgi:DNA-binding transcriptional regulator YiaG
MPRKQRPRLFERLKQGLEEGARHARGELQLVEESIALPLPPPSQEYGPAEVKAIRERLGLGQVEFATIFLVSPKTVQSWEQGTRSPSPAASRLLQVLERPGALERLRELVVETSGGRRRAASRAASV